MVTALIFAGGVGERMNSRAKPKQFLEIHGKPILIYTLDQFEMHEDVDNIAVVCLENWINELKIMLKRFMVSKVKWIVPGGKTGHDSIFNGLQEIAKDVRDDDIIIIHDGVRPLITGDLISKNIQVTREKGNAVTVLKLGESIARLSGDCVENGTVAEIPDRNQMCLIKAPQTFFFREIWDLHQRARKDQYKAIDSACLLHKYGHEINTVASTTYNIKITSPSDYYIFRAMHDAQENLQIFGLY